MSRYKKYYQEQEDFMQKAKDFQIDIIEGTIVRLIKFTYDEAYKIGYEKGREEGRNEDFAFTTEEVEKVLNK
tara:strand:- start:814 stop:1029 length:216 start_codon:yes stop_codon:yes gene_type:complete